MPAPHEVVATPLTIYLAAIDTAFPDVADDPSLFDAAWQLLGKEGDANYDDSGVSVDHSETVVDFTPAGRTMPSKRFRTTETFELALNLVDLSPETYAKVMNDAELTSTGTSQSFSLYRGDQVNSFAVLARGMSTVDNTLSLQYVFSKAFVSVSGKVEWTKGKPSMLPVTILAIRHADTDLIECQIQTV
jgi:hypothetical protein